MKKFKFLLFSLFFIPILTYGMLKKIEDAMISGAEKMFEKVEDTLIVKDQDLFKPKKPIELIQFPTHNDTTDRQTHAIAKELIQKLSKRGLSLDDVTKTKIYFVNQKKARRAFKIFKEKYPALAKTATFHKVDEMPDENYAIYLEIKANPTNSKKNKARL